MSTPAPILSITNPTALSQAVDWLAAGRLVVLPTDTGYALAGRADRREVVRAVFQAKNRPLEKALPVLAGSLDACQELVVLGKRAQVLAEHFLPGALTLILPRQEGSVRELNPQGESLGVRIPDHPFALKVLQALGLPITGTSANRSGDAPAFSVEQLEDARLLPGIAGVFAAGALPHGQPSTIVELLPERPMRLLREGPIPFARLQAVLETHPPAHPRLDAPKVSP